MGTVDPSARVLAQSIVRALGWAADDLLTITAAPGVVIMRRDPRAQRRGDVQVGGGRDGEHANSARWRRAWRTRLRASGPLPSTC
jgi:hypothetical protein